MTEIISIISSWALTVIDRTGYVGIFFLSMIESAGIPMPSEVVLPFSGFLAHSGRFSFLAVVVLATIANYVGSVILFWIGISGGRFIIERYGKYFLISSHDLELGDKWFDRHGTKVVFWGRLLPIIRTFVSLPAGVAKMNFSKFSLYTLLGAFPWNLGLGYVGLKAGENWDILREYFHDADLIIGSAILLILALFIYKKWKNRNY